jgi:S-adenosylmethionine hydrolase
VDAPDTVYFLSDYGTADTFVGVVHAVLRGLAPSVAVIDLTHEVAPFDVRGGSLTLAQAVPHLGPGVVLAVVDPGVGVAGGRRCVAVSVGPQWFVGPDNGLLTPALDALGGLDGTRAWELPGHGGTFDGRDVLAPAAAAICWGADESLGDEIDPAGLVRLPAPVVEHDTREGRAAVRAEVTALDRFGNVQLAARPTDLPTVDDEKTATVMVTPLPRFAHPERPRGEPVRARRVRAFGDLEPGELGLLVDSNGHLALVLPEASAASALCIAAGDLIELTT